MARDHGVTWYSAVPTLHQLLLARAADPSSRRPAGTERLRFIRSCSASLPPRLMHALEAAFGAPVLEAYGMTEAAHQMASNPLPPAKRKPGSVGRGTDVRISIMDTDGRICAPGERGEVVIQGPNVIRGYENNPGGQRGVVRRRMVPNRRPRLSGRRRLPLARRTHQGVDQSRRREDLAARDRRSAARRIRRSPRRSCSACRTRTWGEEVAAAVVLRDAVTEAELLAYCREHLADYKRPKQIHITDAIPRTATGKIQRGVVAKAYRQKPS